MLKRKAVERGAITAEQAERMTDTEAVQLIFEAGLSTARELSDVSGRGVGMDIVRANVEKINGSVEVSTRRGGGTTFTIRLPLTLAIIQALLVRVAWRNLRPSDPCRHRDVASGAGPDPPHQPPRCDAAARHGATAGGAPTRVWYPGHG